MRHWILTGCWVACVTLGTLFCVESDDTPWNLGRTWDEWVAPLVVACVVVVVAFVLMIVAARSADPEARAVSPTVPVGDDPRRPQRIWSGMVGLCCLGICLWGFGWMLSLFFSGQPGMDGRWGSFAGSVIVAVGGFSGLFAAVVTMTKISRLDLADHRARQGKSGG